MPKISEKNKILNFVVENAEDQILDLNDNEDDVADDIFDDAVEEVLLVMECRRGVESLVPKSVYWRDEILSSIDDVRFKQMLRVNRQQFWDLLTLIANDPVFNNQHSMKQFPVGLQLGIVLFRLEAYGGNASIRKIASTFGVGDGGTIDKITKRVFRAILRIESKYIYWPSKTERDEIVATTFHELPYCIGYVDGTEIKLAESPVNDHVSYFSKSRCYSIKTQVVCDNKLRARHLVVGHVGSCHDAKIYRSCSLFKHTEKYFSGFRWIAGDSAYPLSETVITPYRSNSKHLDIEKRKAFNLHHSKYRVRIEHFFGMVKEKFESLKELRMRIHNDESRELCCEWFRVCCVLHYILITDNDIEKCSDNDYNSYISKEADKSYQICQQVEIKRQAIYSMIFD